MRRAGAVLREGLPLLLLLLALSARSLWLSTRHLVPVYDEVGYMEDIRQVARRGEAGTIACYLRGECRGDNRNPLYEMLAAPFVSQQPGDFAVVKLVTLATGLLLVLAVYALGRGVWGPAAALAAAAVPALSWDAANLSQSVLAGVLYAALFFSALAVFARWRERREGWLGFGLLAGLAYLAKASGHFLLLGALAVAVDRARRGRPWRAALGWACAGFAVGAGLVLWRNVLVWHNPFYNVNAKVVWLDSWNEQWLLQARPERWSQVGALAFLRRHSLLEVADRFFNGLGHVTAALISVLDAQPFSAGAGFAGVPILGAALGGLWLRWRDGGREEVLAVLGALVPLYAAHCWGYSAGIKGMRFMLPFAAVLAPYAALSARLAWRAAWDQVGAPPRLRALALPVLLGGAGALAVAGASYGLAVSPLSLWGIPAHWQDAADWIKAHVPPGRIVTSSETAFSIWDLPPGTTFACPYDLFDEDLRSCVDGHRADFVLVDRADQTFDQWPARLGRFDVYGPTSFLGWPRVYHDPLRPSELSVYARPGTAGATPASSKARAPAAPSRSSR